jgi:MerR family copper efflux transcriptional regulator
MLKIGEVSKRSGVGIEALRFYEKGGLLDSPSRTYSGYRVYGEEVLERLAFIKRAQALGFSLDEIRRIIDDARKGESPCDEVREIVRRRLAELDERMREMRLYRKELAGTLEEWDEKGTSAGAHLRADRRRACRVRGRTGRGELWARGGKRSGRG